jgi:hypothetical protein
MPEMLAEDHTAYYINYTQFHVGVRIKGVNQTKGA